DDLDGLLRGLGIEQAYVGGLSMGGATTLHFGLQHPEMARALVIASAGSGSVDTAAFRESCAALGAARDRDGITALDGYAAGPARVQLRRKDPRGYEEFRRLLFQHSADGSAFTIRNVQGARPPVFDFEEQMRRLAVPALILIGDEDEPCIEPGIFMKRTIPGA